MPYLKMLLFAFSLHLSMSAADKAYPQTAVDRIELKTIPASRLIASQSTGHYFSGNNGLFRPLFRYISQNNIAMTTPVEADMMPGKMYFYIGGDAIEREFRANDDVELIELPERLVASIGARGGYSEGNFNEAREALEAWLAEHPTHQAVGAARGIFWNGPYVPAWMKRFEVHIPVAEKPTDDN